MLTHPKVFDPPSRMATLLEDLEQLFDSPSLTLLGDGPAHPGHLRRMVAGGGVSGNLVHDAHIAALAIEHGVRELLTLDRDFDRFPGLRTRHPFAA